jgi:hypothetical protein
MVIRFCTQLAAISKLTIFRLVVKALTEST